MWQYLYQRIGYLSIHIPEINHNKMEEKLDNSKYLAFLWNWICFVKGGLMSYSEESHAFNSWVHKSLLLMCFCWRWGQVDKTQHPWIVLLLSVLTLFCCFNKSACLLDHVLAHHFWMDKMLFACVRKPYCDWLSVLFKQDFKWRRLL